MGIRCFTSSFLKQAPSDFLRSPSKGLVCHSSMFPRTQCAALTFLMYTFGCLTKYSSNSTSVGTTVKWTEFENEESRWSLTYKAK
ncbi:hypothetical protein GYMLUDRAFT_50325 [Collybiopsis luxurians FD-317 M1]|uniref:Uncharacterized protein n=1 Tax=Collybiopsis luxurians FD-317 M1 TaxID=944289 RepID=A0A0D0AND7_9AGAR|nr:hypothetical protein GYMLUDRAFT_50325 [Collybiopsis luxurians FD-317 M1]